MPIRKHVARLFKKTYRSVYRRFVSTEPVAVAIRIVSTQTDLPASTPYYPS